MTHYGLLIPVLPEQPVSQGSRWVQSIRMNATESGLEYLDFDVPIQNTIVYRDRRVGHELVHISYAGIGTYVLRENKERFPAEMWQEMVRELGASWHVKFSVNGSATFDVNTGLFVRNQATFLKAELPGVPADEGISEKERRWTVTSTVLLLGHE